MTADDLNVLTDIRLTSEESSSNIRFEDLSAVISLIERRKLDIIRQYIVKGYALTATIEMTELNRMVNTPVEAVGTFYPQASLQYD